MPLNKEQSDLLLMLLMTARREFEKKTGRQIPWEKHLRKGQSTWTIREIAKAIADGCKEIGFEEGGAAIAKLVEEGK